MALGSVNSGVAGHSIITNNADLVSRIGPSQKGYLMRSLGCFGLFLGRTDRHWMPELAISFPPGVNNRSMECNELPETRSVFHVHLCDRQCGHWRA